MLALKSEDVKVSCQGDARDRLLELFFYFSLLLSHSHYGQITLMGFLNVLFVFNNVKDGWRLCLILIIITCWLFHLCLMLGYFNSLDP